ncbi:hypothetical protein SAMN04489760_1541, partial [Syntrophus gentianae]
LNYMNVVPLAVFYEYITLYLLKHFSVVLKMG